jgi:hypothetical protein
MARAAKMKKSILLMVWPLLAVLAAYGPAEARRLPDLCVPTT